MAKQMKTWSRQDILDCLDQGKQDIIITGEPKALRLIGAGIHGAITKDAAGYIDEFPLRLVEDIK